MSIRRTVLSAALAWLVVVAVGSMVVWAVISRAGQGIAPSAEPVIEPTSSASAPAAQPTRPAHSPHAGRSSGTPHPSTAPTGASAPATPGGSLAATSSAGGTGASAPTGSPRPTRSAGTTATTGRRTWEGVGGFVTVECRGPRISLVATSADPGFVVEERHQDAEEVQVKFEGQGDERRETEVHARCQGGTPVFEVSSGEHD